jgi:hypothetical protein
MCQLSADSLPLHQVEWFDTPRLGVGHAALRARRVEPFFDLIFHLAALGASAISICRYSSHEGIIS